MSKDYYEKIIAKYLRFAQEHQYSHPNHNHEECLARIDNVIAKLQAEMEKNS